jgi:hypothetical protein
MPLKRVEKTKLIEREKKVKMLNVRKLNLLNSGSSGMKNSQLLSNRSVKKKDNAV